MTESDELACINGVKPKVQLKDGEDKEAKSESNANIVYRMRRTMDHYYCNCPAWRNQARVPVNARTCKHLKKLLGDAYEKERLEWANPSSDSQESNKKTSGGKQITVGPARGKRKAADEEKDTKGNGKASASRSKRVKNESETELDDASLSDLERERSNLLDRLGKVHQRIADIKEADEESEEEDDEASDESTEQKLKRTKGAAPAKKEKATIAGKGGRRKKQEDEDEDVDMDDGEEDEDEEVVETMAVGSKAKPLLLLAEKWDLEKGVDPTNYHVSEKLDGVRAYWNGNEFMSREGNKFYAPDWFVKKLPRDITLDGEFFAGRQNFQDLVSIVKTQNSPDKWKFKVEYHVFDIPSMGEKPFEERYEKLKTTFAKLRIKWVTVVEHTECKSKDDLLEQLEKIQEDGGEGLMLREPKSVYIGKRSRTLLKVKTFHDADAEVLGYVEGKGRNAGVTGALRCKMLDGGKHEFSVGSGLDDKRRKNPPKVGAKIIYRYFELTKSGMPRFPTFVGERGD